ncbi:MAG: ABC transporter ATP-binding protein, partial [Atopobiaceae bacterium]|nr:ABC transporter ATP-binding protein [Atopobiaceae bacterium]
MSVLRFLKHHLGAFALVCLLLAIQAVSELALPQMMSDIVDVGIGQQGIPSAVFAHVRAQTLSDLESHLEADEVSLVESFYAPANPSGVRTFEGDPAAKRASSELSQVLSRAIALETGADDDALAPQRAIAFVTGEYEQLGLDLEDIRRSYLISMSASMFGYCAVALAAAVLLGYVAARTGAVIGRDTREDLFDKVMRFSPAEVNRFSQASLITRCTNDVMQVSMSVMMLMRMVLLAPIMGIVAITKVLAQPSGLGFIIIAALLMLLGLLVVAFIVVVPTFERMQALIDRVNLMSRQMLEGIMPVRAFGRETYEEERFDGASTELRDTQLFTGHAIALIMPVIQIILNAATVAIVWFGADLVGSGAMQVGDVMAYSAYAMQIVMSFMMLAMVAIMMPRAKVAADRVIEVLECPLSIVDPDEPHSPAPDGPRGSLVFDDVSFRYPDADADVISHVDFTLDAGQVLGIVGSTGSGKSTLVQLIPRLYDVTGGAVLVDGVDVRSMSLADLRGRIG